MVGIKYHSMGSKLTHVDNDPLSSVIAGRKIEADPTSESTVQRALSWMRECDEPEQSKSAMTEPALPPQVLDVQDGESGGVTIHGSSGEKGKYAALSHIRDVGYPVTIDKENTRVDKAISLETLPQTYRDAIIMTRKLGLRYLWIESLCSQEDHTGKTLPSPKTASIYADAYITLSATGSSSDNDGILTARTPPSYYPFQYISNETRGTVYASSRPKEPFYYFGNGRILEPEPLSQHGWALQDRIFSPCILHFGTSQLYFESNTHFVSEDGFEMTGRSHTLNEISLSASYTTATVWSSSFVALYWQTILDLYCRRTLPDKNDKLPAISSIAAHITSKSHDAYVAGLWRATILDDMIWQATGHARGKTSDPPEYRAPSWSWASIDGPFGMFCRGQGSGKGGWMEGEKWSDVATVVDYNVTPKGEDPYGEVTDGWIKLRTPLEKLERCEDWQRTKQVWKLKTANGSQEGTVCILDTKTRAEEAEGKDLFALVLVKHGKVGGNLHYHGIIVTAVEGKDGTYRRLGKVVFDEETLGQCEWMGDEEKVSEVIIV
ncbi:hypothetical protein DE146DRAFT_263773 [Phaeosphaeria sp. MPI-PUGE-AT-0046c]|nr:hypothetical protein DE146DRAFT_263773 [Phaeosphaeria sp. MPI-PUGE-AT-0046c]